METYWKPVETHVFNIAVFHLSWGLCFFPKTATSSAPGNPPFWVLKIAQLQSKKKKQESRWIKRLFAWSMFLEATCNDLFLRSSVFKKREFLSWWVWQLEYKSGCIIRHDSSRFPPNCCIFSPKNPQKTPGNPTHRPTDKPRQTQGAPNLECNLVIWFTKSCCSMTWGN